MTADSFYGWAGILIFVPWAMLIFLPNGKYSERVALGAAVVLLVAAAYFTFQYLSGSECGGSFLSLEGFKNLFRSKEMLLTGWLNYLSFCLLVGAWQFHDSGKLKIGHIFVVPALVLTMLAGPVGLLLYLLIRFFKTRDWEIK
jgi:hypothetical protein